MATATVTATFSVATLTITDGETTISTHRLTQDDGPGPVPAAEATLARDGWTVGAWTQQAGGVSGGVWTTEATR